MEAGEYRLTTDQLMRNLNAWDTVLPGRGQVRLIACGGTALSLLGYKESTKDVDFLIPDDKEYVRFANFLAQAGYQRYTSTGWKRPEESIVYDLFSGKLVYTTELLTSPLEKNGHKKLWQGKKLYLGVLNSTDLAITKLFRGASVDYEDCKLLVRSEDMDLVKLKQRYKETASFHAGEQRLLGNLEHFLMQVNKQELGEN